MALPTLDELVAAYAFLARRIGVEGNASTSAIAALLREAQRISGAEGDEPAALFYAPRFLRCPTARTIRTLTA